MPIFTYLSRRETAKALDMQTALACAERVYRQTVRGEASVSASHAMEPEGGALALDAGLLPGICGFRTVSRPKGSRARGLPDLTGLIMVYSAETGLPLGAAEASWIAGACAGAAGAVGARALAVAGASSLLVVGAGDRALFQIAAMLTALPALRRVTVAGVRESAVRFLETLPGRLRSLFRLEPEDVEFRAAEDLEEALAESEIAVTVTASDPPLIRREWVRPGAHISCLGGRNPDCRALESGVLRRARIYVDDPALCAASGEVGRHLREGAVTWEDVAGTLGQVLLGELPGRESREAITVLDVAGLPLLDVAAAAAALSLAEERDAGTRLEL